jgi:hypothetical protein
VGHRQRGNSSGDEPAGFGRHPVGAGEFRVGVRVKVRVRT